MFRPARLALVACLVLLAPALADAQGHKPAEAAGKMTVAEGLTVKLFASEPEVRQPILVQCDDRGRLWTIQYLQYPNPAGLKRVRVDRWSRAVYDRVPEPPPRGPRGADRITICEDADGDGKADRFKDFATGLNLCTGLAFGPSGKPGKPDASWGVYVLQAPYLLFYPDNDRDDIPDSNPEVLLSGFGMEDSQSLVNHLTWGPDGWLYGCTGSTSTNRVRSPQPSKGDEAPELEFQQAVWRYHPFWRRFELFCEGGGNLFGLTFDADGNLFASSNGSQLALHAVQGAYYRKAFDKHGPLHNPYAYGFLEHLRFTGPARGPTPGGSIYLGQSFPQRFHGALLCCDFLDHAASAYTLRRRGSTFEASFSGRLLDSNDTWFCAPDLCQGPDGSVYICDFHDRRTAHPDPDADWDRSNGRIYKIEAKGSKPERVDLARKSSRELVELLRHPNGWYGQRARVLLAARRDRSVWPLLREMALQTSDARLALQGTWGLYVSGGFEDALAVELLKHPAEQVRTWTVRLLGDEGKISSAMGRRLADLAATEPSVSVRAQLAATARRVRLPAVVERLLLLDLDADDPHLPWLLWWAVADLALTDRDRTLDFFLAEESRRSGLVRANLPRLVRRCAAEGTRAGYEACQRLVEAIPNIDLLAALDQGLTERGFVPGGMGVGQLYASSAGDQSIRPSMPRRAFEPLPAGLVGLVRSRWQQQRAEPVLLRLAMRVGVEEASVYLVQSLSGSKNPLPLLDVLEEMGKPDCALAVLALLDPMRPAEVQLAALRVLGRFPSAETTDALLGRYDRLAAPVRARTRDVLFSSRKSALAFLQRIESKQIAPDEIPLEQVRRIAVLEDAGLDALVRKHWGNLKPGTAEEKLAVMRRFANDLRAGPGERARGKELFRKHCASCHRLFDEGENLGPDLTGFARGDTEALLASIVDPSAVIRKEFLAYVVTTRAGVVHTGLIAQQDAASVTLAAQNARIRIRREEIEEMQPSLVSLMPERLLEPMSPQERRDLFSYLQR